MVTKIFVERILTANGLSVTASTEEVRALLSEARWHEKDIKKALAVLSGTAPVIDEKVKPKFNFGEDKIHPETVSSLLGLETTVSIKEEIAQKNKRYYLSRGRRYLIVGLWALMLSIFIFVGAMWYFDAGWFHYTWQQ